MIRLLFLVCFSALIAVPTHAVILDPGRNIRAELLGDALIALEGHDGASAASNRLVVVDYSIHSAHPRLFVVNLETGAVDAYHTTHGQGSDPDHDGYLDSFSNEVGSNASPRGAFRIAETYYGKHGISLRIDGLGTANRNARARAIVIHAAPYAEPEMITHNGKLGRSNGCVVFSKSDLTRFMSDVPRDTLLYIGR